MELSRNHELVGSSRRGRLIWDVRKIGLTDFLERVLDKQAKDCGLKEVLMGLAPGSSERITRSRSTLHPLAAELVERAVRPGAVRPDSEPQDFGILQLMVGAVIDAGRDVSPDLWRRYLAIMLQGLRARRRSPGHSQIRWYRRSRWTTC
jgi:hypothetical protein